MKLTSPSKRWIFVVILCVSWFGVLFAEALSMIIYLFLPHDPLADSPGIAIIKWKQFAYGWLVISPLVIVPAIFAWFGYSGNQQIMSFNKNSKTTSVICWLFFGFIASVLIFDAIFPLFSSWFADSYKATYFLSSIPNSIASIILAYVLLSASSEIMNR